MADFRFFHNFIFANGSAKSSYTAIGSWFFWGVKFHEWSTSAKFAQFTYLEKTNYTVVILNVGFGYDVSVMIS